MTNLTPYHNPRAIQQTDTPQVDTAGLPLLAVLRKGGEKIHYTDKQGKDRERAGKELPYFRPCWRGGYEHMTEDFTRLFGDHPEVINGVRFLNDTPFHFAYESWNANGTLRARHNGRHYLKRWTPEGYNFDPAPLDKAAEACTPVGRLSFWLPALAAQTGEFGMFIAITGSINDCNSINAYLAMLRQAGVPITQLNFDLYREARDFTVAIKGKPSSVTKYMIRLKASPQDVKAALMSGKGQTNTTNPALSDGNPKTLSERRVDFAMRMVDLFFELNTIEDVAAVVKRAGEQYDPDKELELQLVIEQQLEKEFAQQEAQADSE